MTDQSLMLDLHNPHDPYWQGRLRVEPPHELYVEASGNKRGQPALFLHGGPGFAWPPQIRRFFDPRAYHLIAFDQRGAYRSTPLGELKANTTAALIADIETIRCQLGIERWVIFGGSWGSALALAYAQNHPERTRALVLWGVYLGHAEENEWNFYGTRKMLPEAWHVLADPIPPGERRDLLAAYRARFADPDPKVHMPALDAWLQHNRAIANLRHVPEDLRRRDPVDPTTLAGARIAIEYFANEIFLPPKALLAGAGKLHGIPGVIAHGRVDYLCPIENAFDLHRAWQGSRYVPVEDAGHSCFEPAIQAALLAALDDFKSLD